ncbi:transcriptional regulator [Phenylobacterium sp.]|uniref:helix-turn-helix transcriptional regulator n=1 Tax=Phenylobacterium sp. TaxID=1871053 RepID=UPI00286D601E|nr:transcriptional regulator [Phenylobacterium sp.]
MNIISRTQQIKSGIEEFDRLPDAAHVRLPVVQVLYGCSEDTVQRGVAAGRIPKPRKLSPRANVWNVGELRAALARVRAA